jgi:hypothetical protein
MADAFGYGIGAPMMVSGPSSTPAVSDGGGGGGTAGVGVGGVPSWTLPDAGEIDTFVSSGLNYPQGMCMDSSGNIYVVDTNNYRIAKIAASDGAVTTFAGGNGYGTTGDGGAATSATLGVISDCAISATQLLICDNYNGGVRAVNLGTGIITTVSSVTAPFSVAFAANGTDFWVGRGSKVTPIVSGVTGSDVAVGGIAYGLAVDENNAVYAATDGDYIYRISGGSATVIAGTGTGGSNGDGTATEKQVNNPSGLAIDNDGRILVCDTANNRVREIVDGTITTLVGNGTGSNTGDEGAASSATILSPYGICVDSDGNYYVGSQGGNILRVVRASA